MKTPEPIVDTRADIRIEALDPAAVEVQALIAASDAFYDGLYPEESNHLEALDDLDKSSDVCAFNIIYIGSRLTPLNALVVNFFHNFF